jgi:hypothetical protein
VKRGEERLNKQAPNSQLSYRPTTFPPNFQHNASIMDQDGVHDQRQNKHASDELIQDYRRTRIRLLADPEKSPRYGRRPPTLATRLLQRRQGRKFRRAKKWPAPACVTFAHAPGTNVA